MSEIEYIPSDEPIGFTPAPRPWLFEPGDKVLCLYQGTIYSGVVQQVRMPGPVAGVPDHIIQVAIDEHKDEPDEPWVAWWNPDQVERIGQ